MSNGLRKQVHRSKAAHGARGPRAVDPSRPKTVIYAVYLASAALVLVIVGVVAGLAANLATSPARELPSYPLATVVLFLLAAGMWGLVAYSIYGAWRGRNRWRILYIGLALLSIVSTLANAEVLKGMAGQPLGVARFILTTGLDLAAVTLLILPISNAWFRARAAERPLKSAPSSHTETVRLTPGNVRLLFIWESPPHHKAPAPAILGS